MYKLSKKGFNKDNIVSYGNMFLIGNGHLGYRGTLEEFSKDEMVGLNVVGFYDKYQNKWRESLNIPNPFFAVLYNDNKSFSILNNKENEHTISLDIKHAIFKRTTKFEELEIKSERFISQSEDNLICFKYQIKCKKDIDLKMDMGCDLNIYEINGPHFPLKEINESNNVITFKGKTNERKYIYETNQYIFPSNVKINHFNNGIYNLNIKGQKGKTYTFYCFSNIDEHKIQKHKKYNIKDYKKLLTKHKEIFDKKWDNSDVVITGNKKAQFAIRYSIYHLLILGNKKYQTSIPARGVSGQTYKGAIFWDTEIFLLPFFTLTDINVAKQLLKYRIKTLKGALRKAKLCGYSGAFYAWESQEKGQEGCSKYNVSDPITNKPVRTYFGEKQIHISADIAYGLINYTNISGDESLLLEGGLEMMVEICNFYISYTTFENGKYHLNDVIGPDEYHERVDDNAFTNYMVYHVIQMCVLYMNKYHKYEELVSKFIYFANNLYLPKVNKNNLIEQFKDYFKKEDVYVDEVRKRIRHPQEYWGTKNGVAYNTRVIKQADVITLLVLLSNYFNDDVLKANFDFYYPYTEHGSSLSASMYSIAASFINKADIAYQMFIKSATIDLGVDQKMFAGGIYIGGTHPASNGGSYLSLLFGFAGLRFINDKITLNPHLPKQIKGLKFKILYKNKKYKIDIYKDNSYNVEEVYD